ncbi:hypothetical protein [Nocardia transvalensis]|uniref:hypothetical protein n=1 Tax=Nocardia transvalensis TaxID=37333 RepID=UPI00189534A0|nr:hypothetical protein [Nocardia transvalensis]MBF6333003.1 hypothetical protein [Nocardia transvalensis]
MGSALIFADLGIVVGGILALATLPIVVPVLGSVADLIIAPAVGSAVLALPALLVGSIATGGIL